MSRDFFFGFIEELVKVGFDQRGPLATRPGDAVIPRENLPHEAEPNYMSRMNAIKRSPNIETGRSHTSLDLNKEEDGTPQFNKDFFKKKMEQQAGPKAFKVPDSTYKMPDTPDAPNPVGDILKKPHKVLDDPKWRKERGLDDSKQKHEDWLKSKTTPEQDVADALGEGKRKGGGRSKGKAKPAPTPSKPDEAKGGGGFGSRIMDAWRRGAAEGQKQDESKYKSQVEASKKDEAQAKSSLFGRMFSKDQAEQNQTTKAKKPATGERPFNPPTAMSGLRSRIIAGGKETERPSLTAAVAAEKTFPGLTKGLHSLRDKVRSAGSRVENSRPFEGARTEVKGKGSTEDRNRSKLYPEGISAQMKNYRNVVSASKSEPPGPAAAQNSYMQHLRNAMTRITNPDPHPGTPDK